MIRAVLLDLDDTLLGNQIDAFLPVYLERLGAHLNDLVPAEQMIPALLQATRRMMQNRDPARTLEQAFAQAFYPALGVPAERLRERIDSFYATEFPRLRDLTRRRPEARPLVESALQSGLQVAVATNPLFPLTAIAQRLAWAGVPPDEVAYAFVASYETMHFCKPDTAYFTEILGRLGAPAHESAMIGDNPEDDLAPAGSLGLATFRIAEPAGEHLERARLWLREALDHASLESARSGGSLLAHLRGFLAAWLGQTDGLGADAWTRRTAAGGWAPIEIVCHVRDVELEVSLPRVEAILASPNTFISAADTDPWAETRRYLHQDPREARQALLQARTRLIARLEALDPPQWEQPARHALLGPTTLRELVAVAVDHDRQHLAQLRGAIGARV